MATGWPEALHDAQPTQAFKAGQADGHRQMEADKQWAAAPTATWPAGATGLPLMLVSGGRGTLDAITRSSSRRPSCRMRNRLQRSVRHLWLCTLPPSRLV